MRDENSAILHRPAQDFGIGDAVESRRKRALKIYRRFAAQYAGADRTAKIVIGLKTGLHLFRTPGMQFLARRGEALTQILRKRGCVPPRGLEALQLA